jgi:integrase
VRLRRGRAGDALGTKPIEDVTTADVKHAVATWRKRKRTKACAKGGTVAERHFLQTARHVFNFAIREEHATKTPFRREGVTLITVRPGKGRTRRLEGDEDKRLRMAADPFISDFYVAMIETACRPGELRTLQWSEVRQDHFIILASKAKDREERRIPILPTLRAILDRRRIGPDRQPLPDDANVFGNEAGEQVTRRRLCSLWAATCKRAGVENLHLHDLRGEAGSQLLEAGVPIHEVRDALGHSSTTMTSHYLRTRTDSLTSAYERRAAHQARQALKVVR